MRDWLTVIIAGSVLGVGLIYLIVRVIFRKLRQIRRGRVRPEHVEKTATVMDAMMRLLEQQRTLSNEITDSLTKRADELKELIRQADETIARLAARVSTFSAPQAETIMLHSVPHCNCLHRNTVNQLTMSYPDYSRMWGISSNRTSR